MEKRVKTARLDVLAQEAGHGDVPGGPVAAEDAVRPGAARVHHALGDALVVEVGDLLAQVVVLQQRRAARARLERVVGVAQAHAGGRGQERTLLGACRLRGPGVRTGRAHHGGRVLVRLGRQRGGRLGGLLQRRRAAARGAGDGLVEQRGGGLGEGVRGVAGHLLGGCYGLLRVHGSSCRRGRRAPVPRTGGPACAYGPDGWVPASHDHHAPAPDPAHRPGGRRARPARPVDDPGGQPVPAPGHRAAAPGAARLHRPGAGGRLPVPGRGDPAAPHRDGPAGAARAVLLGPEPPHGVARASTSAPGGACPSPCRPRRCSTPCAASRAARSWCAGSPTARRPSRRPS